MVSPNTPLFGNAPMRTSCGAKGIKIENEDSQFVHQKLTLPMRKRIQNARNAAGLTQKELAQKLNVKPNIIQSYENGSAIPVGRLIQHLEKVCNVPYGTISGKPPRKKKKKKKKETLKIIYTKPRSQ